jgi:hypothetical protein
MRNHIRPGDFLKYIREPDWSGIRPNFGKSVWSLAFVIAIENRCSIVEYDGGCSEDVVRAFHVTLIRNGAIEQETFPLDEKGWTWENLTLLM